MSKIGYTLVVIGSLLTFGGTVQLLATLTVTTRAFLWGGLAILGLFVLSRGVLGVLTDSDDTSANPRQAIGKTDSRFGGR